MLGQIDRLLVADAPGWRSYKGDQLHATPITQILAERSGKKGIGFTTAYMTWKDAAMRQGKHKNIAPATYIWIREDGAKQFSVETFESSPQRLNQ